MPRTASADPIELTSSAPRIAESTPTAASGPGRRKPRSTAESPAPGPPRTSPASVPVPATRATRNATPAGESKFEADLAVPQPDDAQIRERAYHIWLARGDAPGDAMSDWLTAEQELLAAARAERLARLERSW